MEGLRNSCRSFTPRPESGSVSEATRPGRRTAAPQATVPAELRGPPHWTLDGSHLFPLFPTPQPVGGGGSTEEHEGTRNTLLANAHPWSTCPAPPTSPSTSGTARASSRQPEETRRIRGRSPGARAGRRRETGNPASASIPQAPKTCASAPAPTRSRPAAG